MGKNTTPNNMAKGEVVNKGVNPPMRRIWIPEMIRNGKLPVAR